MVCSLSPTCDVKFTYKCHSDVVKSTCETHSHHLQLSVSAKDKGLPTPRLATNQATVQINVIRNEKDPIFFQDTYSASLEQNKPVGTQVVTVKASDADTAVGGCSMNRVSGQ